jgi:hypothetical protein
MVDSRELTRRIEESPRPSGEPPIRDETEQEDCTRVRRGLIFGFLNEGYFGGAETLIQ